MTLEKRVAALEALVEGISQRLVALERQAGHQTSIEQLRHHNMHEMKEGVEALEAEGPSYDVVITDMSMEEGNSGLAMLKAATERDVFTEVIVLTAYGNVKNAVECMQMGAYDYVEKNIPDVDVFELLMLKVDRALQQRRAAVRTLDRLTHIAQRPAESAN